ncbi:YbfB/YjiJ family MFS transporter [Martelella alba]|uniref:YbfB/YjiJ family MFS transporter n=1 Tax=Martelella alba TaxID=2590451 RepID=A0ABY2SDI2_9HYPH|nr:YbfB/YjiJ family MFS transporter [Martelella alba]TKI02484.1 YbfB/YjiJ family MFS transporter [Martelella alba]
MKAVKNACLHSPHPGTVLPIWVIVVGSTISLGVAMGISRFAFTPILPMMIHDGVLTLAFGSTLASVNYLGYLAGAMLCMGLPPLWSSAVLTRWGLLLTVVLTFGMLIENHIVWIVLRFLAGVVSAVVLVHTSRWCLALLGAKGRVSIGSIMFTGVGMAITLSGLAVSGMVQLGWGSRSGWMCFGVFATLLVVLIWRIFRTDEIPFTRLSQHKASPVSSQPENVGEMTLFSLAYGLAGFGYIITATFLPVIARITLPPSASIWLDLFWPTFGISAVAGSILVARIDWVRDPRLALVVCYVLESVGVVGAMIVPTITGFFISSLLAGLPFNAINFFTMREVTRLRPLHAARYMGLLTALFSVGQIAGPPMVNELLSLAYSQEAGFSWSLQIAAGALLAGAFIFLFLTWKWPIRP